MERARVGLLAIDIRHDVTLGIKYLHEVIMVFDCSSTYSERREGTLSGTMVTAMRVTSKGHSRAVHAAIGA